MYEHIKTRVEGSVATLTLSRDPLNVLNIAMMKEMNSFLDTLKGRDDLKVLLIKAEGKAFSAGVDVGEHLGDQVKEMIEVFHAIFRRMDALGLVSVAQVQGAALGGGCEVALYSDLVIASEKANFGQPEIVVGVFPPVAALVMPRVMGRKKALELCLTGDVIGCAEAKEWGLVNHMVAPEDLEAKTAEVVGKLTKLSPLVLKLTKKACLQGIASEQEEAFKEIERIYLDELMVTADAEEGLRAFLDKRKPEWKNK